MTLLEQSRALDASMVEDEGHLVLTDRTVEVVKRIYNHTKAKNVLEIGFNAGHSALCVLSSVEDVRYHSIDICQYDHTEPNAQMIADMFPERFTFQKLDSKDLDYHDIIGYDMVFVDGAHDTSIAALDIQNARYAGVRWILIDDYEYYMHPSLTHLINHYIDSERFPYHLAGIYRYDNTDPHTKDGKMVLLGRDI